MMTVASNAAIWTPWVGLPYQRGADPRDGQGCDCLELAIATIESVNDRRVVEAAMLRDLLLQERWQALSEVWREVTEPIIATRFGDVALVYNPPSMRTRYGLVVAVNDRTAILAPEDHRVMTLPIERLGMVQFRRYRYQADR